VIFQGELPHGFALQFQPVSAVQQSVEDGIGEGGLADVVMPVRCGQLAGDQSGTPVMTVFDHLHQILSLGRGDLLDAPVVEDQQIHFEQLIHQTRVGAVTVGDAQLFEQGRQTQIAHRQSLTASLVAQGTGEPGLAATGRAGNT